VPIKLYFSPHDEAQAPRESEPRQKTWAEATIPTPFFAEFHLKNLREDLTATQINYELAQRQLESARIEKRSLHSQARRVTSERDTAVRERDSLLREKQIHLAEKESLVAAGRQLETTVAALRTEMSELRAELLRASAVIDELETEKRAQNSGNGAKLLADESSPTTTKPDTSATPADPASAQSTEIRSSTCDVAQTKSSANCKEPLNPTHVADPPPVTLPARDPPPLPASMSLDEILAGGLRKYMPSRSRIAAYHT